MKLRVCGATIEVFGAMAAELIPAPLAPGGPIEQPVMYERETETYRFMLVRYQQERQGIPVFRSDLRVLVRNEDGFPVVLGASSLHDLGGFMVDPALAASPFDRLEEIAPEMTSYSEPEVVIWAGVNDTPVEPVLAITFTADNYENPDAEPEKWLYVADAATGAVLYRESLIVFGEIPKIHVRGNATPGYKAEICSLYDVEKPMVRALLKVDGDEASYYTDEDGDFEVPEEWGAVTVYSYMEGEYFTIADWSSGQGAEGETLSGTLTAGEDYDFLHNATGEEFFRSQVNCYIAANEIRDRIIEHNGAFPVISAETGFAIRVNKECACGGSYDGSINLCRQEEGRCANTGWNSILYHEYGHHAVQCAGTGQGEYGEGMADSFAMVMSDDPVIGYGFDWNCDRGIRTADNEVQYPCESADPHVCGVLLSGCVWSIRNELVLTEPDEYLQTLSGLVVNSILLRGNGDETITPEIATDFLTVDDDDAILANGTPHCDEICTGFALHGMYCPLLAEGLSVQPEAGLVCAGERGVPGSFEPLQMEYTLQNVNESGQITYSVDTSESWVTASPPSGTIPAQYSVAVTVTIDPEVAGEEYGIQGATVTFSNTTDHVGDTTRVVEVTVAVKRYMLDATEPTGWTREPQWEFGRPLSGGGTPGYPDPASGATGYKVYGVNLDEGGTYATQPGGPYYLTTAEIPLQGAVNPKLRFKRWLNTDHWPYAAAMVEASPNGAEWTLLWSDGGVTIADQGWTTQTYDLSEVVGTATKVYVRWGYQIFPGAKAYSGWNIDDIEILGDAAP